MHVTIQRSLKCPLLAISLVTAYSHAQADPHAGGISKTIQEVTAPQSAATARTAAQELDLAGAFIFTDSKKSTWYKISNELISQEKAIRECKKLGLELPSAKQIEDMKPEISAAAIKDRRLQTSAWTATKHPSKPGRIMVFIVSENGLVSLAHASGDNYGGVICVSQ